MKIVILDGYTENPGDLSWSQLEALGKLIVYDRSPLNDVTEVIRRLDDVDVVYTNKTPMSREAFYACPNIQFVGVLAIRL